MIFLGHAHNYRVSKCMKEKLTEVKGEMDKPIIIVDVFSIYLSVTDG